VYHQSIWSACTLPLQPPSPDTAFPPTQQIVSFVHKYNFKKTQKKDGTGGQ
jgi:hypothetical protein